MITPLLTSENTSIPPSFMREEPFFGDPALTTLTGQMIVVKLGGSTLEHQREVLQDILSLRSMGMRPVLVHGGGPYINELLQALHIPTRFEGGLRVTDARTLEVVCMVLRGQINEHLVLMAAEMGGKIVGLSGTDGGMIRAHIADERLGLVGEIDAVDPTLVQSLMADGYIPIIAPLGQGPQGSCLNINADLVAAHLARALSAEELVFLSDVVGILDVDGKLIAELSAAEAHRLIEAGVIKGGMIPKVAACLDALKVVPRVHIVDGRVPHLLLHEVGDARRVGTMIVRGKAA